MSTGLVAAGAAGVAVLVIGLLQPPFLRVPSEPGAAGAAGAAGEFGAEGGRSAAPPQALLRRLRTPLVGLAVVAGWTVLGGWPGTAAGLLGGLVGWRALGRLESPAAVRRRESLERDLPVAVFLLGAALGAGASPVAGIEAVAEALPGPIAEELLSAHHRLLLGLDPVSVWRSMHGPLQPLGRTMVRAHQSGASVKAAVESLSAELRLGSHARVEALARSVEVRAAAPLGLCFLPAFVLLGVVPMIVGIFSSISLFS